MAVRIFETDPAAFPKVRPQFADDLAYRLRAGKTVNDRPVSLPTWRITTGDPAVAEAISKLLGGAVEPWATTKEDSLEVITEVDSLRLVIDGADAVESSLVQFGRSGPPIHVCDGVEFLEPPEDAGRPCGCPALLSERKAQSKTGRGPSPLIKVTFRLADSPDLGKGQLTSSSWELLKVLHELENALDKVDGPALVQLSLELVQFTTQTGVDVSFRKPVFKVLGPVPAAEGGTTNE
ncbi:hypothetical protein [Kitasatospora sp. NPDC088779]|uniref:recombination directionality factor n=1 Tax=Kitasatospora sp. NPDC088779 TaxID=3154964 RepID=UPI00344068AB